MLAAICVRGRLRVAKNLTPKEHGSKRVARASILSRYGTLIGPGLFTFVFAAAIKPEVRIHLPGAPFLLVAVILLSALPVAAMVTRREA
jgi:DHA1 family tetracycline resistance protein-like MFS transporter